MQSWECQDALCLARPCRTGLSAAGSRVLPSLWSWVTLCKPLPKASIGQEAPGPTGSLWRNESTYDLESEGPAKGITMRNVTRHSSLGCVPTWGMGVRRHTGKPDGIFQGHSPLWREAQGPFPCPFPSQSLPGWLTWEGRRLQRHKINGFLGRGQPPTRPGTILRWLPRPGSVQREVQEEAGERPAPCAARLPGPPSAPPLRAQPRC